jgi:hypothetical protein
LFFDRTEKKELEMKSYLSISSIMSVCAVLALTAADTPVVSGVVMSQGRGGGRVSIDYNLNMPAVVTLDIQTNVNAAAAVEATDGWVSIGDIHLRSASGDVNKIISGTSGNNFFLMI